MRAIDAMTLRQARELAERLISESGAALTIYGPFEKQSLKASLKRP